MSAFPKDRSSSKLEIRSVENPMPDSTLGDIGIAVEVRGPNRFPVSILIQPVDLTKITGIDPFTTRLFRYDNKSKSLQLVSNSGSNVDLGFIWAKICRPGIYVAIGLPQDLVIRELLKIVSYQHKYAIDDTETTSNEIVKVACNSVMQCAEEELEELRRMMTLHDVQTRLSVNEHQIRRGNAGTILPYPLPGNRTLKEFKERIARIRVPQSGLPEEMIFSTYENVEDTTNVSLSLQQNRIGDTPIEEIGNTRTLSEWSTRLNAPWIPFLCFLGRQNWWTYHHDERLTGVASCSNITSTTVGRLRLRFSLRLDGPITSIPSIVWNKIYIGTANSSTAVGRMGGTLYKIDLSTGVVEATFTFNTPSGGGSRQGFAGISGSPAVYGNKVYFSGLDGKVYCLNALTLTLIWKTDLRNTDFMHNQPVQNYQGSSHGSEGWSSPLVVMGRVYVGFGEGESNPIAGTGEKPNFGYVYCLDANTGNVIWLFCTNQFTAGINNNPNVIPPSNLTASPPSPFISAVHDPPNRGASPWSSCCYDRILNRIYIGTGNSITDNPLPDPKYASGVLSLDAITGYFKGFFQFPPSSSYRPTDLDVDVPAGPMLFHRSGTRVLAIGSKNGSFFLLNPVNMEELGRRQLLPYDSTGNPFPTVDAEPFPGVNHENFSGIFATAAVHYGLKRLFVGIGGYAFEDSIDHRVTPFMRAINWDNTLADAWATSGTNPPKYTVPVPPMYTTPGETGYSSPAIVNDVVFISTTKMGLYSFDASTGLCLWSEGNIGSRGFVRGPAIYRNSVVIGTSEGNLNIYSL